jgi:hypothetical protein
MAGNQSALDQDAVRQKPNVRVAYETAAGLAIFGVALAGVITPFTPWAAFTHQAEIGAGVLGAFYGFVSIERVRRSRLFRL